MRAINLPLDVSVRLNAGAALAVSISGGKDSQALAVALSKMHRAAEWPGPIFALHADLGRAEWAQTPAHVERIARDCGLPLVIVRRPKGDLVARIQERAEKLAGEGKPHWPSAANRYCTSHLKTGPADTALRGEAAPVYGKPHWPSSAQRYCTSDLKRGPIDTALRQHTAIISAEGVRKDESRERAKKPASEPRAQIVTRTRDALTWRPLLDWSTEDVWAACGTSAAELARRQALHNAGDTLAAMDGWPCHPAYVLGNRRLSCAICVLADRGDIANGLRHAPALAAEYIRMERETGFTFRQDLSLEGYARELGLLDSILARLEPAA